MYSRIMKNPRARRPTPAATLALTLALLLPACSTKVSTNSIEPIAPARVGELVGSKPHETLLLDARTPEAFQAGRLPGARRVALPDIDPIKRNPDWERFATIVVYGENPGSLAAEAVTKRLLSVAYERVYLLEGGFAAWQSAGLPVER